MKTRIFKILPGDTMEPVTPPDGCATAYLLRWRSGYRIAVAYLRRDRIEVLPIETNQTWRENAVLAMNILIDSLAFRLE